MKMLQLKMQFGTVAFFLLVFSSIAVITQADLEEQELVIDVSVESLSIFFTELCDNAKEIYVVDNFQGHGIFKKINGDERTSIKPKWIKVNIHEVEVYKGSLYFRGDSLVDLLAFANSTTHVHYMKGYDKLFEGFADTVALPFTEVYDDLADQFGNNMADVLQLVTLGKEPARIAANDIANFAVPIDKIPRVVLIKRALLIFKIMIVESLKSKEIRARITDNWNGCTRITRLEARRILQWDKLSDLFLNRLGTEDSVAKYQNVMNDIEVTTIDQIGDIVDFMVDERNDNGLADLLVAPTSAHVQEIPHMEQYFFWRNNRNNILKHILPHPPPKPIPASAPAPVSALGVSAAAMTPMQFIGSPETK